MIGSMRDFKKYQIWQQAFAICTEAYNIANQLPSDEKFGLRSQMTRAAVSIPSNIAEGCARNSDMEFKRFLEIAIGSAFELETQVLLSQKLKFVDESDSEKLVERLHENQASINALIQKLKST